MILNYGSSMLATMLVKVIEIAKVGMKTTMLHLVTLTFIFFVLTLAYEFLLIAIQGDLADGLSRIFNEMLYMFFILFIMLNWLGGINLFGNIIEPLFFEKIPNAAFHFKVGGFYLKEPNGALLNLDYTWDTLQTIPQMISEKNGVVVLVEWVLLSNIGLFIAMMFFKAIIYIVIVLIFADILKAILEIHILFIFAPIMFIFTGLRFLRDSYGLNVLKIYLVSSIQYYFLFIVVGFITGFMEFVAGKYSIFIAFFALLLTKSMFTVLMKNLKFIGERL